MKKNTYENIVKRGIVFDMIIYLYTCYKYYNKECGREPLDIIYMIVGKEEGRKIKRLIDKYYKNDISIITEKTEEILNRVLPVE